MLKALSSYWKRLRRRVQGRPYIEYFIEYDEEKIRVISVTIDDVLETHEMAWHQIVEIYAYKRDLFAVDLIVLWFSGGEGTDLQIDEEMNGWEELINKLPDYLPGCLRFAEWWREVAFPPFAVNPTKLYRRDEQKIAG